MAVSVVSITAGIGGLGRLPGSDIALSSVRSETLVDGMATPDLEANAGEAHPCVT